jgi:RNA polymerase sigma factor (sigma-70 family)
MPVKSDTWKTPAGSRHFDSSCRKMTEPEQQSQSAQTVYVVDDDASARDSLCWLLGTEKLRTRAFASAGDFLGQWSSGWSGCVTLDIRMPDMSGLQVQQELQRRGNRMPVVILTGHADVPIAIRAMKLGAHDFLEKPYSDSELLDAVGSALARERELDRAERERGKALRALEKLTEREREVMRLVVDGSTNKAVAAELGISEKTVEVHRARVMHKTGADTFSALVRFSLALRQGS